MLKAEFRLSRYRGDYWTCKVAVAVHDDAIVIRNFLNSPQFIESINQLLRNGGTYERATLMNIAHEFTPSPMENPPFKGKLSDLTDEQLAQETAYWAKKIDTKDGWGGALAAAMEFHRDCLSEKRRRDAQSK